MPMLRGERRVRWVGVDGGVKTVLDLLKESPRGDKFEETILYLESVTEPEQAAPAACWGQWRR